MSYIDEILEQNDIAIDHALNSSGSNKAKVTRLVEIIGNTWKNLKPQYLVSTDFSFPFSILG